MAPESRGATFTGRTISLAAAAVITLGALTAHVPAAEPRPWAGGATADFALPTLGGADVELGAYRGRVVLVHFFATWCEPCIREIPALARLVDRAKESQLAVVAISVADADLRLRRFLEKTPVNYPVLLDRERAVSRAWTVSSLPTTVVLDPALNPKFVIEAEFAWDDVEPQELMAVLAARAQRNGNAYGRSTSQD